MLRFFFMFISKDKNLLKPKKFEKRIYSNHGFDPLLTGMTVEHDNQYTNESYPYKLNLHLNLLLLLNLKYTTFL